MHLTPLKWHVYQGCSAWWKTGKASCNLVSSVLDMKTLFEANLLSVQFGRPVRLRLSFILFQYYLLPRYASLCFSFFWETLNLFTYFISLQNTFNTIIIHSSTTTTTAFPFSLVIVVFHCLPVSAHYCFTLFPRSFPSTSPNTTPHFPLPGIERRLQSWWKTRPKQVHTASALSAVVHG